MQNRGFRSNVTLFEKDNVKNQYIWRKISGDASIKVQGTAVQCPGYKTHLLCLTSSWDSTNNFA